MESIRDGEIYILAVVLQRIPRREYYTQHITLRLICGTSPGPQLPRTVNVRHGDSHFDEVGVFGVVCAGVAQLGGERFGADGAHPARLTHSFEGIKTVRRTAARGDEAGRPNLARRGRQ